MRVLIIHNYYQSSGGERVAVEAQINLLKRHGHQVVLYARDNKEIQSYNLTQKVAFVPNTIFSRKTNIELTTLVQKTRPDIIHVHNVFPLISPSVYSAMRDVGIPIVQTLHNFRFLCPNGLFFINGRNCERCKYGNTIHSIPRRCYRESYVLSALYAMSIGSHRHFGTFKSIDRFIALTEFAAEKIIESGIAPRAKISILGNFIQIPPIRIVEKRKPYVVYLGRLSSEKGIDVLIGAMDGLSDIELKIAGNGPQLKSLSELAEKRKLGHVHFIGYVEGKKKLKLLSEAQAIIVPSVCYENFPYTVLESMAIGTPIIASNIGGLSTIIEDHKSGLLFDVSDSDALRKLISYLRDNPSQIVEMGHYARSVVETNYTETPHYDRLMQIYNELLP